MRAFPFDDLLTELRARGMSISVREHLATGKLLSRWDQDDLEMLRAALAALLSRNPEDTKLVVEVFNELYLSEVGGAKRPEVKPIPPKPSKLAVWLRWSWMLLLGILILGGSVWTVLFLYDTRPKPLPQPTPDHVVPRDVPHAPEPPVIEYPTPKPAVDPLRVAAIALGAGLFAFSWRYFVRTRRTAQRIGRREWVLREAGHAPPMDYQLDTRDMRPTLDRAQLDDVATLLARKQEDSALPSDIDVDRSVEETLRAGLAPTIAFRRRAIPRAVVVLVDMGEGSHAFLPTIEEFVSGLAMRGVQLQTWRFYGDPSQLRQSPTDPAVTLGSISRSTSEAPMIIISSGARLLDGEESQPAPWIGTLKNWRRRVWLHPNPDPASWSLARSHAGMAVFGLDSDGILAAAREVIGESGGVGAQAALAETTRKSPAPLESERMRWLLSFLPKRDPRAAELLRQRFAAWMPRSAIAAAWARPRLERAWPLTPNAEQVASFVDSVLDRSEPAPDSFAHARWKIDRATVRLNIPGQVGGAIADLNRLATMGYAPQVEHAIAAVGALEGGPAPAMAIPAAVNREVRKISRTLDREAQASAAGAPGGRRPGLVRPGLGEVILGALVGLTAMFAAPLMGDIVHTKVTPFIEAYRLWQPDLYSPYVSLSRTAAGDSSGAPFEARLERNGLRAGTIPISSVGPVPISNIRSSRPDRALTTSRVTPGGWFQAQASLPNGTLAVSNLLYVPDSNTVAVPVRVQVVDSQTSRVIGNAAIELQPLPLSGKGMRFQMRVGKYQVVTSAPGYNTATSTLSVQPQPVSREQSVTISLARAVVDSIVPDLVGLDPSAARARGDGAGFTVQFILDPDLTVSRVPSVVISQTPAAGTRDTSRTIVAQVAAKQTKPEVTIARPDTTRLIQLNPKQDNPAQTTGNVVVSASRYRQTARDTAFIEIRGQNLVLVKAVELPEIKGVRVGSPVAGRGLLTVQLTGSLPTSFPIAARLVTPTGPYMINVERFSTPASAK
jgi:hypothetical protein